MQLLGRARSVGWRIAVRGTDSARLEQLDEALWLGPEESFLAHGLEGGAQDAWQPILLTQSAQSSNAPQCVMSIDGAEVSVGELPGLERACILFDGHDEHALTQARAQWRALTDAGAKAQYWSEASGRWEKRAEN